MDCTAQQFALWVGGIRACGPLRGGWACGGVTSTGLMWRLRFNFLKAVRQTAAFKIMAAGLVALCVEGSREEVNQGGGGGVSPAEQRLGRYGAMDWERQCMWTLPRRLRVWWGAPMHGGVGVDACKRTAAAWAVATGMIVW